MRRQEETDVLLFHNTHEGCTLRRQKQKPQAALCTRPERRMKDEEEREGILCR